ncbi:site-specific integrase [Streptomyces atratus]|uniref:hypothetical protein n=1 Tax=Streptomyces atratus TaxID=1893 RepID=UPI00364B7679
MAAVPHRPRLPATGPIFIHIDRHGNIGHRMFRNGEESGDPSGRMTGDGIAEIVTRAVARAGLTARPNDLLAPDLPARWTGHSLRRGFATAAREKRADTITTCREGGWGDGSKAVADYFDQAGI